MKPVANRSALRWENQTYCKARRGGRKAGRPAAAAISKRRLRSSLPAPPAGPAARRLLPALLQPPGLLGEEEREALAFEHVEAAQHFGDGELVLEVDLIVEVGAEAVLLLLPVLRHEDDGHLQSGDDAE